MNLAEWRASMVRRDSSDFAMPGTTASSDPEGESITSAYHGCKVRATGNTSIVAGAATTILAWNTDVYDTDNIHSTATNTGRFYVPEGLGGFWRVTVRITTDTFITHNNRLDVHFVKNNTTALQTWRMVGHAITGDMRNPSCTDVALLVVGDYVHIEAEVAAAGEENVQVQGGGSAASYVIFEFAGPQGNANVE